MFGPLRKDVNAVTLNLGASNNMEWDHCFVASRPSRPVPWWLAPSHHWQVSTQRPARARLSCKLWTGHNVLVPHTRRHTQVGSCSSLSHKGTAATPRLLFVAHTRPGVYGGSIESLQAAGLSSAAAVKGLHRGRRKNEPNCLVPTRFRGKSSA